MGVVIHVLIAAFSIALGESGSLLRPSTPAVVLIGLVWLTVLAGGYFRYLDVKAGGAVMARRFGAVHASDRSRFDQEQRLLNVVAEVSIASTTPQPEVYVLRSETSINAMVLGGEASRYVVVVTQGLLDAFDRDQLQAVVAHEFAHIKNGDLPLNMRLLVALGGLMAIDEVGHLLVGENPRDNFHPGVPVGYLLRALGSIGVFFGRLIRAAFSRQREFLADASAVQFTRNPFALASALVVIRKRSHEPALHNTHVQELAHLCFQSGDVTRWYQRLLASHPTLQRRIDAIDPHFSIKQRKAENRSDLTQAGLADLGAPRDERTSAGAMAIHSGTYQGSMVGGPDQPLMRDLHGTGVSDRILLLLPDESSCLAILFALFVSKDTHKRREYFNVLTFGFNERFTLEVREVVRLIPDELHKDQLAIIEYATGVLRDSLTYENRQRVLLKLERLLKVGGDYSLMNYATLQLIRRRLAVEFPVLDTLCSQKTQVAKARRAKAFDVMGAEFALLLSLMVESSGAPVETLDDEFKRVLKCYTQTHYPRRTASETGIVTELEAAFQTLYMQPKTIRQAFVQHCIEIVQQDNYVAGAEQSLLSLFAASLGCEELAAA